MKIKRKTFIIFWAFMLIVISASLVFAFLYQRIVVAKEETVGEVLVSTDVYFMHNNVKTTPKEFETINGIKKSDIYEINITTENDPYHISKLRIDFNVSSNIETYFRFKILDTLTLKLVTNYGFRELDLPNEGIDYPYDDNLWFYNPTDGYYYFKSAVMVGDYQDGITFLLPGLEHESKPPQYKIQLRIIIEAVQSVLGPENNWHLEKRPWDGGDW